MSFPLACQKDTCFIDDMPTRPAAAITERHGDTWYGTIGFDLYLAALGVTRAALKAPKVPEIE